MSCAVGWLGFGHVDIVGVAATAGAGCGPGVSAFGNSFAATVGSLGAAAAAGVASTGAVEGAAFSVVATGTSGCHTGADGASATGPSAALSLELRARGIIAIAINNKAATAKALNDIAGFTHRPRDVGFFAGITGRLEL